MVEKLEFKKGDFVVYPAHGVGRVEGVDSYSVSGMDVSLYSIMFEQDRMRLKVPVSKAKTSGLRRISSRDRIRKRWARCKASRRCAA
jgi:CarD family transcriptional regulator